MNTLRIICLIVISVSLSQCTKFTEPDMLFNNKVNVTTIELVGTPSASSTTISSTIACEADNLAGKERGVCFSLSGSAVTISANKVPSGTGVGTYNTTLTNLLPGRTYYYRSYLIYANPNEVFYGSIKSFNTPLDCPTVITSNVVRVNTTVANLGGNVIADGGAGVSDRGVLISFSNTNPTIGASSVFKYQNGTGTGAYSQNFSGISAGTRFYVRAYATNAVCTSYGNTISFLW